MFHVEHSASANLLERPVGNLWELEYFSEMLGSTPNILQINELAMFHVEHIASKVRFILEIHNSAHKVTVAGE